MATAAAALLTLGTTAAAPPATASANGGGAVTGTLVCNGDGTATMTFAGPVFAFNGNVGAVTAEGTTTGCIGPSILADSGSGDFTLEGPGVSCDFGGTWIRIGTYLQFGLGGPCTFAAGGGHNVQFLGETAIAGTTFAGGVAVIPLL